MDKYLTKKACPGKGVQILESLALLALFGLFAMCIAILASVLMMACQMQMFGLRNLLPVIPAALLALAMHPLTERIRARKHARVIARALLAAEGQISADEAEEVIGVRRAAETALTLVEKGYLTNVRLTQGWLCVAEIADALDAQAPAEEVKPLFKD